MTRVIIVSINGKEYQVSEAQLRKLSKSKYNIEVIGGYDIDENDYNSIAIKHED